MSDIALKHLFIGLAIRLILTFVLPALLDDGLLLQGVRYTDIDYDVFNDAARHVALGQSPYERHTYRYTPFLASLMAIPYRYEFERDQYSFAVFSFFFSGKYFGKILFCVADAICGYIIIILRRSGRTQHQAQLQHTDRNLLGWRRFFCFSTEFIDALWWLYNPLPINICTRGSAESLVVLLPVLATVAFAEVHTTKPNSTRKWMTVRRACFAGIVHGFGIHSKLYPVIYTVSYMAYFSHQQQSATHPSRPNNHPGWNNLLPEQMQYLSTCFCCRPPSVGSNSFPVKHPMRVLMLALLWAERLFFTMSSIVFLVSSLGTAGTLTFSAVYFHGHEALEHGFLYHFQRVDHRHNYSMYFYWIYLTLGREFNSAIHSSSVWGHIPTIPQIFIIGFASLGIAPYDLTFALFLQTFAFVAFNKVVTAQYFTWYLCLLPLCSYRIIWRSKRMVLSLGLLFLTIVSWLSSAFTLEMLGWRSHRQVWLASVLFFAANINILYAILKGYRYNRLSAPGQEWSMRSKVM